MFDYNHIILSRQRHEEIARRANAPEPEGWTYPVPNIFDKLLAAVKPLKAKRTQQLKGQHAATAAKPSLARK